ncbi:sugar phosphate nucleotidyltransferase [Flexivirga meconopsidis]|uniref:sugar phosphate nucleotidyltransferase n=1 Tax=Flexivirga meconopsidis TaxID=2977121 RepID=UPI00223FAE91|nr:sugar phosphate nucleotidyltransferase [Flexivirga meconopsidis]
MKVVLFCGGYGMRMRSSADDILTKPMHLVGPRPIMWHVMRYYAHYGHKEFILCLGYGANQIKEHFLRYDETASNDFVLRGGEVDLLSHDIADWTITFVDTGLHSPIGERLRQVREHLGDDEMFLANYADVLTDAPLDQMIDEFTDSGCAASLMAVPPQSSFHVVQFDDDHRVNEVDQVGRMAIWENGGYFVLRPEIFDYLPENGDLVEDVCVKLAGEGRLKAYPYSGFWKPADTFKERAQLDEEWERGDAPWAVWREQPTQVLPG